MAAKSDGPKKQKGAWEGAFAAYGQAFDLIKKNPTPAYLYVGAYLAMTAVQIMTINTNPQALSEMAPVLAFEGLFVLVFLLAVPVYALALADRKQISIGEFMRFNGRKYWVVLAAGLLYALIVLFSFLLFIIPAIWTIAWFAFGALAAVDKKVGPIQALKASKQLAQNNKGKVWGLIGVSILLGVGAGIVASVPIIGQALGALLSSLLTLVTTVATALLYRWLQTQNT